jgi:hypothetical protein
LDKISNLVQMKIILFILLCHFAMTQVSVSNFLDSSCTKAFSGIVYPDGCWKGGLRSGKTICSADKTKIEIHIYASFDCTGSATSISVPYTVGLV